MSEDQQDAQQDAQALPPGVFVYATRMNDGSIAIDFKADVGVDPLSIENLLELGAVKARAGMGLPPRR
jgi:hypothetical protein